MLSKILVGVLGVAVLAVGSYVYWKSVNAPDSAADPPAATSSCSSDSVAPCCQEPSRSSCLTPTTDGPCCLGSSESTAVPDVLAIQPREVK